LDGGGDVVGPAERAPGLGERPAREAVPGRQHLVVAKGMDPTRPRLVELRPDRRDSLGVRLAREVEDVLALEVRPAIHAPVLARAFGVGAEDLPQPLLRPDEELALVALGIRVLRRVEAA